MKIRRVTITRAAASFSTAASHVSDISLIREIENVTDDLICVATRVKELRQEVSDAAWEGKDTLQKLTNELKYYERLANDGVKYEPTF